MSPEDQYPSTDDCAPILSQGDDPVLLVLENALARYEERPSRNTYIGQGYSKGKAPVCAIGAVWAVGNGEEDELAGKAAHGGTGAALAATIEEYLRQEALDAIGLLNAVALEEHPDAVDFGGWSGPLEWVNQEWKPPGWDPWAGSEDADLLRPVSEEVARLYRLAIDRRKEELAVA